MKRRSLSPSLGARVPGLHATRRAEGGPRRELANRVTLRAGSLELLGWALNISRGGIRVILEDSVDLGQEYEVAVSNDDALLAPIRHGRIVWVQEEPDGMIAGVQFVDAIETGVVVEPASKAG